MFLLGRPTHPRRHILRSTGFSATSRVISNKPFLTAHCLTSFNIYNTDTDAHITTSNGSRNAYSTFSQHSTATSSYSPTILTPTQLASKFQHVQDFEMPQQGITDEEETEFGPESLAYSPTASKLSRVSAYIHLRRVSPISVSTCPPDTTVEILKHFSTLSYSASPFHANRNHRRDTEGTIITDAIVCDMLTVHKLRPEQRRAVIVEILQRVNYSGLSPVTILRMVEYLLKTKVGTQVLTGPPGKQHSDEEDKEPEVFDDMTRSISGEDDTYSEASEKTRVAELGKDVQDIIASEGKPPVKSRRPILRPLARKIALELRPAGTEEEKEAELRLMHLLNPLVLDRLSEFAPRQSRSLKAKHNLAPGNAGGPERLFYSPPAFMAVTFVWIKKLLMVLHSHAINETDHHGLDAITLQLFSRLTDAGFIMESFTADTAKITSALSRSDIGPIPADTFVVTILVTLVRASHHWNRPTLYLHLLQTVLYMYRVEVRARRKTKAGKVPILEFLYKLGVTTMQDVLEDSKPPQLALMVAGGVLRTLHQVAITGNLMTKGRQAPLPPALVQVFYRRATGRGDILSAENRSLRQPPGLIGARDFYIWSRSPHVTSVWVHQPPFKSEGALKILASLLLPTLRGPTRSDEHLQGGSVNNTWRVTYADEGLGTPEFPENPFHPPHIHYARLLAQEVADGHLVLPINARARFIALCARSGFASTARKLWTAYSDPRYEGHHLLRGHGGCMIRMVSLFAHLAKAASMEPHPDQGYVDEPERLAKAQDYLSFADHVLDSFVEVHQPLKAMPHHSLTSLARANMILGRFREGFAILKTILHRPDVKPDMADINVSLSFLAEQSPQAAAKMMERMADRGLAPDTVTIGTIVHWGLVHGDLALVSDLLEKASGVQKGSGHRAKRISLSPQTTAALSRALADQDTPLDPNSVLDPRQQRRNRLEAAYSILVNMDRTPNVAMSHIGKTLVLSSLKLSEPVMAYRFWKLLLRDYEDWQDREQLFLRRIIAGAIRRSRESHKHGGQRMLGELTMTSVPGSRMSRDHRDDGAMSSALGEGSEGSSRSATVAPSEYSDAAAALVE